MSKLTNARGAAALLIGAVALSAMSFTAASAANCSYVFTKTLKKGSTGVEVMNLQKVLNMNAATTVSTSGAGSAGNETMYFGAATHAAVVKFQAANSVSPTSGLVGPLTRGVLNTFCSGTGTTTPTTPGQTGPVSVSNGTQPTGSLVTGQAGAALANFNFTGTGTVTNLTLQRTGVSTNSTLTSVYLYDGATRLTDSASVTSDGKITFNAPQGLFSVSGSKMITLRADISAGTNGQTVGVMLSNMTPMGGSSATVSGVMGADRFISTVTTAGVIITNNQTGGSVNINSGLVNQNVWDANVAISNRDVWMKGISFKYIGSAPTDALANLALFVDGVKVKDVSLMNVGGNTLAVVDLMGSPVKLQTGTRLVQLRADIVKGSARSFQFQVQNSADYMFEDRDLVGVNIAPTYAGANLSGNANNFQISNGNLTINQDSTFNDTKVVANASNAVIGKFRVQAFGEDVKVETVTVTPVEVVALAPYTGTQKLQNVTLYANGSAVGSSQNWDGTSAITFNLGSSMIVPAGATQTLEVKADIRANTGAQYTTGTIRADVATVLIRGQLSQNTITPNVIATGRNLAISTGSATFAKTGGFFGQTVTPNTTGVKIGSFVIQAGDAEDLRVTNLDVKLGLTGSSMPITNLTNLRVTDSTTTVFNPVASSTGGNNFTLDVIIPKSASKTFDVTVDLGSTNNATSTVMTDAVISYRGVNTGTATTGSATGVLMTANNATINAAGITKLSSSPVSQLAVGGTSGVSVVTYNVKTVGGNSSATITDLTFNVAPSADAITKVTVGGKSATVVGSTATVEGLTIAVPAGSAGVDVPVTVDFGNVAQPGGLASQASALSKITLSAVEYTSGTFTEILTTGLGTATHESSAMQLVGTKPTLTVNQSTPASGLSIGENKIGEVTVAADAKGNVKMQSINFDITLSGITGGAISACKIVEGTSGSIAVTGSVAAACSATAADFTFGATGYTLQAGQSKTFSVYATVAGTLGTSGQSSVSTKIETGSTGFTWDDVNGGGTGLTGANIYNYPTNSWSVKN